MKQVVQTIRGLGASVLAFGTRLAPDWLKSSHKVARESGLAPHRPGTETLDGGEE